MKRNYTVEARAGVLIVLLTFLITSCSTQATTQYWGQIDPPQDNKMRYITGSEPESLDPSYVTGQPEARILIGLYDRLVEYHPKTMSPIPALATHWEANEKGDVYTFHLRENGKFSNGDPIKAQDFVWSFQRALSPELASRYGFLGYDIKYAEAYNAGKAFVKKDGKFVRVKGAEGTEPDQENATEEGDNEEQTADSETTAQAAPSNEEEGCTFTAPECVTVAGDEESRNEAAAEDEELKALIEGAEFVPVEAKHLGVEAPDDFTVRVTLKQSAPYFVGLLTHQFFAVVHRPTIEEHGKDWIKPENIVTSGSYKLKEWKPYDSMTIEKDPNNWDAANVKLDEITFYPMDEQPTMMNIYKAGRVDALYNHTVPAAWNEYIRQFKDEYLLHPEMSIEYYTFSVKKPPVDKVEVRRAFSLAIDREALEKFRKTVKKLGNFTPEGIFPDYEKVRTRVFQELLKKEGISEETWGKRYFDPQRACDLMKEAGYTVQPTDGGKCKVTDFPADQMTISYNTAESNKAVAEFVQAQWRQNLGITVQLKNMEWKTYLDYRSKVEYTGAARAGWVGDYMDPFTFLSQFYTQQNDSSTGWWKEEFDALLEKANNTADPEKRFELLAEAEFMMLQEQPIAPLATQGTSWMKKPYVKGMYPNPGTMHPWKFVYIEEDRNKWDANVDGIMTDYTDPAVEAQVEALTKTQTDFEASRKQNEESAKAGE
ncbi:MAG: peptide ABC transporter substrate-binding protein [Acidobacteria bacterium]|nr:MAG: peptide ABC transporter substrate-binding protein [Acidobacteriota bacterium]REK02388.1 MAG: peptide ABC transporter substrate-binding protein [Acidobacteriota bacterium]REK13811.1 MAG: peptide ABC transporter substrate-binding protein [Acidobacteriota bacterium]REK41805.1 MAG: peptide ABC transporter substrate-binding protein [Acidobacteriota bacterium]